MQRKALGGVTLGCVMMALCVVLGMGIAVYAQQQSAALSATGDYKEQNEKLRETLREGMERLQEKQQNLMEWLQEGSQQVQADQQQMDVIKQGLDQLESNRRYLEWLQQGILQLQEEQAYMDSLREDIESLQRTQQQTMQQWLESQAQQAEAAEMERTRTEMVHSDAEKSWLRSPSK